MECQFHCQSLYLPATSVEISSIEPQNYEWQTAHLEVELRADDEAERVREHALLGERQPVLDVPLARRRQTRATGAVGARGGAADVGERTYAEHGAGAAAVLAHWRRVALLARRVPTAQFTGRQVNM